MTNNKRAVIYCRVSTKEQVEEGNSLITQERHCREYAAKNGYEIAAVYIEQGESAKTADRKELQKMLSFCSVKKNCIHSVIAYKIDRVSRNIDDYSFIRIQLRKYGVEIKSTSEHFENNPAGRFMENIIANVAQFDNDVRAERCSGGMRDAVREGRYVWLAPVGYENVKVNGKANLAQSAMAPLIKKVFIEIAQSNDSLESIRHSAIRWGLKTSSGKPISKSRFNELLRQEIYCGWISKFGERHRGTFNPIISEEIFEIVQRKLRGNRVKYFYKLNNPDFPLRRFIKSEHGEPLTGCWSKGKRTYYPYYFFRKGKQYFKKDVLESFFSSFLNSFALTQSMCTWLVDSLNNYFTKRKETSTTIQTTLDSQRTSLLSKKQQIVEKNLKGVFDDLITKQELEKIDTELLQLEIKTDTNSGQKLNIKRILSEFQNLLTSPGNYWFNLSFESKIKFQVFVFPSGLYISSSEFRTPEKSILYILKREILDKFSGVVDYPISNLKHTHDNNLSKQEFQIDWGGLENILYRFNDFLDHKESVEEKLKQQ